MTIAQALTLYLLTLGMAGLVMGCNTPPPAQQQGACSPLEDRAKLSLIYLAEAEPVVATGACKGMTPDTCPALEVINKRHEARRKAFVQCR